MARPTRSDGGRPASGFRARFDRDPGEVIDQIRLLDGVSSVRAERQGIIAETSNSDELARLILGPLHGFDLEIQAASLENAFVQLTTTPELEPR